MTSTRHWAARSRQRSRAGSEAGRVQDGRGDDARVEGGRVIPLPVTGQQVFFVCDPGGCSAAVAAAFFDLKVGPLARSRAVSADGGPHPITPGVEAVMAELGIDVARCQIEEVDAREARHADHIVVLGTATQFETTPGFRSRLERWPLDEPSHRGIEGLHRLRLIRDGIESNVNTLVQSLGLDASSR